MWKVGPTELQWHAASLPLFEKVDATPEETLFGREVSIGPLDLASAVVAMQGRHV